MAEAEDQGGDEKQRLEARVDQLESQLAAKNNQIVVLQQALANLIRRVETLERSPKKEAEVRARVERENQPVTTSSRPGTAGSLAKQAKDQPNLRSSLRGSLRPSSAAEKSPRSSAPSVGASLSGPDNKRGGASSQRALSQSNTANKQQATPPSRPTSARARKSGAGGITCAAPSASTEGGTRVWLRGAQVTVYAPSNAEELTETAPKPPDGGLELEYCYGYRGKDCRANVLSNAQKELVTFAATLGIVHRIEDNVQRFFRGHDGHVRSIAMHPDRDHVATGQGVGVGGQEACVCVWSSLSLAQVATMGKGAFSHAVSVLAFSPSGGTLAVVTEDPKHTLSIWDWRTRTKLAQAPAHTEGAVLACKFLHGDENQLVTTGKKHVKFWTLKRREGLLEQGGGREASTTDPSLPLSLLAKTGLFGTVPVPSFISALLCLSDGLALTGCSTGDVLVWREGRAAEVLSRRHSSPVLALLEQSDGRILSGGADGVVVEWSAEFKATGKEWQAGGSVRALEKQDAVLLVGTGNNEVVRIDEETGVVLAVLEGWKEHVTGLSTHPSAQICAVAGVDGSVRILDLLRRKALRTLAMEGGVEGVAVGGGGNLLACALSGGSVVVLEVTTFSERWRIGGGGVRVTALKFSPDAAWLAVGSADGSLSLLPAQTGPKGGEGMWVQEHRSAVQQVDWSRDSARLQSCSADLALLCWEVADGALQVLPGSACKDTCWDTLSSIVGWHVQGAWEEEGGGSGAVTCLERSTSGSLLAAADDMGHLSLLSFPSLSPSAPRRVYAGHGTSVAQVRFSADDSYIVSAGGAGGCVLQWRVLHAPAPA